MNPIIKLIRADDIRKSRFHTANGHLCLNPSEFAKAFATTMVRLSLKKFPRTPWLVYSAVSYIAPVVEGKRIFEFGSGMSSLWFSEHASEVTSVEHNSEWYSYIVEKLREEKPAYHLRLF